MTGLIVVILLAVIFVLAAKRMRFTILKADVYEYQKGLRYVKGRFTGVIEPGQYFYNPFFTMIKKIEMRPQYVTLRGQEVLTKDGVTLKISLAAAYQVVDPVAAVHQAENYEDALYLELQLALREIIGREDAADILEKRNTLGERLVGIPAEKIEALGLKLLSVDIKDIMFPGELKKIFTQVVQARQEGLALLEKARGETAALRKLANAAKMLEKNPALMNLRIIQSLNESKGNTLVLGLPHQIIPLAKENQEDIKES